VLAPVSARAAVRGLPAGLAPTLLAFGNEGPGIDYLYDTSTATGWDGQLPLGYSLKQYRRWETGPIYGPAERVGDRIIMEVGPQNGGATRSRLLSVPDDLRTGGSIPIPASGENASFPAADGRTEWVIDAPRGKPAVADDIDPDTGGLIEQQPAPRWPAETFAALPAGFLTVNFLGNGTASALALTDPSRGRKRVITRNASADTPVIAAAGGTLAWQGPGECDFCRLSLTSLRTGRTRPVVWHPPQRYLCDAGALSPDGRWLAVSFGCPRPDIYGPAPLLLVNVATAQGHLVPGSANEIEGPPVWSSDGHWVIWEQSAGPHQATMRAFRPGSPRPHAFTIHRNPGDLLQALPTPSQPSAPASYSGP
jgi:hypothetical protein